MKKTKEVKVPNGCLLTGDLLVQMGEVLGAEVSRRLLYMWVSAGYMPKAQEVLQEGNTRPVLVWGPDAVEKALARVALSREKILLQRQGLRTSNKPGRALPAVPGLAGKAKRVQRHGKVDAGLVAPEGKIPKAVKSVAQEHGFKPRMKPQGPTVAEMAEKAAKRSKAEQAEKHPAIALQEAQRLSVEQAKLREGARVLREVEERLRRVTERLSIEEAEHAKTKQTLTQRVRWEEAAHVKTKDILTAGWQREETDHAKTTKTLNSVMDDWRKEQEEHAKACAALTARSKQLNALQGARAAFSKEESEYLAAWLFLQVSGHSSEAKRQIHLASAPMAVLSQIKERYSLVLTFGEDAVTLNSAPKAGVTDLVHIQERNYGTKTPASKKPAAL